MSDIWRKRQLLFIRHIVRLKKGLYPLLLLIVTVDGKHSRGRPFQMIKDAFIDNLLIIIPNIDRRGNVDEWIGYTLNIGE